MKNLLTFTFQILMLFLLTGVGLAGCADNKDVQRKVAEARARNEAPPLWRIKRGEAELYIFGSVHVLPGGFDWQKPDMEAIFAKAGTVFFEVSQDEASLRRAEVIAARDGYYSGINRLTDKLDNFEEKLLFAATVNAGLEPGALDKMQPWLAASILTQSELSDAGILQNFGADKKLYARAEASGKYIRYLENMDAHLAANAAMPIEVQLQNLNFAMENAGELVAQTSELNAQWVRGNMDYIEDALIVPLFEQAPDYYTALFTQRNEAWADVLTQHFETSTGTSLVVVGVGHMAGPGNLLQALEAQGLRPERYYAARGENIIKTIDLEL